MPDEFSLGEAVRWIERVEKRVVEGERARDDRITSLAGQMVPAAQYEIAHQALIERVAHHETDTVAAFARVETTSKERLGTVNREIGDLRILVEREVADLRETIRAMREDRSKRSDSSWQRWTGLIAALAAIALVVAQLVTTGGH